MTERDWIEHYIRPLVTAPGAANLRDDVALLSGSGAMVATMDTLVAGRHFLASDALETVGRKLIRVNVSDILAKGAMPHEALLSVSWPVEFGEAGFAALMSGLGEDLRALEIALIGGDFIRTEGPLTLTLTLTGRCVGEGPVRRSGGRIGNQIWVSGEIGWGHVGLIAAQDGGDALAADRYRVPILPDVSAAQTVSALGSASMDVSDGLFLDTLQLAEASGCGAVIDLSRVPLAKQSSDITEILAQCSGGDDYQILMTTAPDAAPDGFTAIGTLIEKPGLALIFEGQPVNTPETLGFEH